MQKQSVQRPSPGPSITGYKKEATDQPESVSESVPESETPTQMHAHTVEDTNSITPTPSSISSESPVSSKTPVSLQSPDRPSFGNEKTNENYPAKENDFSEDGFELGPPNGGWGWVVAIGGMLVTFATWGANASYGVFLEHYLNANSFQGGSHMLYALIGGFVVFLAQGLAPLSLFLCRLVRPQIIIAVGIVVQTAAYLLASFSAKLWQIFLTQGVLVGLSFSLIFIPATLVLPTYFTTRKATAMGIVICGSGLGGVVFSLAIGKLIRMTGDQRWALRMLCIVCLFCALVGLAVLKPFNEKRVPLRQKLNRPFLTQTLYETCDMSIFFTNYDLALLAAWYALALLGYVMNLYTLAPYASSVGFTASQGTTLTALLNAAQVVGRAGVGYIADMVGRYNATAAFNFLVCVFILAFWINASTFGALVAFAILLGLTVGTASTMCMPLCHDLLEGGPLAHKQTAAWGGINVIISFFCLVAALIDLSLVEEGTKRPYLHAQLLGGFLYLACTILMLLIREKMVRKKLQYKLNQMMDTDPDPSEVQRLEKDLEMSLKGFLKRACTWMKV